MAEINMHELIREDFIDDPIYNEINTTDIELRNQLYPSFLDDLHPSKLYSTQEVAMMLGEKEPTVRYYMNTLSDYVQPIRNNRNYRLMYKNIYRLYLIFLYIRGNNRNTNDVKSLLPMYDVQNIMESRVNIPLDESSDNALIKKAKLNEEILLDAFLGNMQYQAQSSQINYQLHNTYIDRIREEKVLKSLELEYKKQENRLLLEEKNLIELKQELHELRSSLRQEYQWRNMEMVLQHSKEKKGFINKIKNIFNGGEEEKLELLTVSNDDPKIKSAIQEIQEKKDEINAMRLELKELEEKIEIQSKKVDKLNEELEQILASMPDFREQSDIAAYFLEENIEKNQIE